MFSWSGCYVGTQGGLGTGHTSWKDVDVAGDIDGNGFFNTARTDQTGGIYGGQAGCDYEFGGGFVVGVQNLFAGTTIASTEVDQFNATWALRDRINWYDGATVRVGYAVDRVLLYTRGGGAFAQNHFEIENSGFNLGTPNATRVGWTLGSGVEWAFAQNWSVFTEVNYYDFGKQNVQFVGNPATMNTPFKVKTGQTMETFTFGVNYKFW